MIKYADNGDVAIFDNLRFRLDKKTGYYLNAKTHKRLHVYVWEYNNGKIPEGYHIHHKDFDKSNNELDNLVLLTQKEHMSLHGKSWDDERYKKQIMALNEKVRPCASKWHRSEKGRKWHKEHYETMKEKMHLEKVFVCEECGKEFRAENTGRNRFCSNACRSSHRRKSGVDNESRICVWCGKEYVTNKYSKSKTCSRRCRNLMRWNKINQENGERICLQHGSC